MDHAGSQPPSYSEAISNPSTQPQDAVDSGETITYALVVTSILENSDSVSLPFPEPESLWQSRGVTETHWQDFTSGLLLAAEGADGGDEAARRQGVKEVMTTWNKSFFEPRNCRLVERETTDVPEGDKASAQGGGPWGFMVTTEKIGFKMGDKFYGKDWSKS